MHKVLYIFFFIGTILFQAPSEAFWRIKISRSTKNMITLAGGLVGYVTKLSETTDLKSTGIVIEAFASLVEEYRNNPKVQATYITTAVNAHMNTLNEQQKENIIHAVAVGLITHLATYCIFEVQEDSDKVQTEILESLKSIQAHFEKDQAITLHKVKVDEQDL